MKWAMQFVLRMYKHFISPMLPHSCRFVPTCSEYAAEAIHQHGAWRGSVLAMGRLLRCHPFARAGYDPVPISLAGQKDAKSDLSSAESRQESLILVQAARHLLPARRTAGMGS